MAATDTRAARSPSVPAPPLLPTTVSVERACSPPSNFLARDLCRVACCEAGNARDPICLWYRKLGEERSKRRQGN